MPLTVFPTRRAYILMAIGFPIGLGLAVLAPALWPLTGGWIVFVLGLMLVDALIAASGRALEVDLKAPRLLHVGHQEQAHLSLAFTRGVLPGAVIVRLEASEHLDPVPTRQWGDWSGREMTKSVHLIARRRGEATLSLIWLRWFGPMRLVGKQVAIDPDCKMAVTPNTRWVQDQAIRLFARHADLGMKTELERGDGSEFDALKEFQAGMDRRAIDWKQSARHNKLLAKEFRTERNHNIVLAYDTSRLMCEPIDGLSRLDRAISAGLLIGYAALRAGDRVSLFGFDATPNIATGAVHGASAYNQLQARAAELDYSTTDANYTLGLTSLATQLSRRSLIILFSEFVDTTHAELMIENVARLSRRHLVLFAMFNDEDLERLVQQPPASPTAIGQSVVADSLLTERALVLRRLQRLGVQILETPAQRFGVDVLNRFLAIKKRELL